LHLVSTLREAEIKIFSKKITASEKARIQKYLEKDFISDINAIADELKDEMKEIKDEKGKHETFWIRREKRTIREMSQLARIHGQLQLKSEQMPVIRHRRKKKRVT
ncbi:unnamed protein product, partial [marine sediment metagenome]